jgi:hypothetical protein
MNDFPTLDAIPLLQPHDKSLFYCAKYSRKPAALHHRIRRPNREAKRLTAEGQ